MNSFDKKILEKAGKKFKLNQDISKLNVLFKVQHATTSPVAGIEGKRSDVSFIISFLLSGGMVLIVFAMVYFYKIYYTKNSKKYNVLARFVNWLKKRSFVKQNTSHLVEDLEISESDLHVD